MTRRLLPEWARQDGVMLTWPHRRTDWATDLDSVEWTYLEIASAICRFQRLLIVAHDAAHAEVIGGRLTRKGVPASRFVTGIAPSNDTWTRDHGPIPVNADGKPLLLDFRFNGWGGKYPYALDDAITATLHRQGCFGGAALEPLEMVLEGGGIETDGNGTLLVTESYLLAPSRNPDLDRASTEDALRAALGIERCHWLRVEPLEGDDTDGHIDTLARFCSPDTIAYVRCQERGESHYDNLKDMERQLRTLRKPDGTPYELIPLPWPSAKFDKSGRRLPATYANFLIINNAVLVPTYRDSADSVALATMECCFPDREIIGIDCSPLIRQNGSLHCITMQLPEGVLAPH